LFKIQEYKEEIELGISDGAHMAVQALFKVQKGGHDGVQGS
jgi:hypothetical protein